MKGETPMTQCRHKDTLKIRCQEQALALPDKSKPVEVTKMPRGGFNVSWPSKSSDHGLCYYHYKKSIGLFGGEDKKFQWFLDALDGRSNPIRRR